MFYGIEVKSGQNQAKFVSLENPIKLTQAVLEPGKNGKKEPVSLMVEHDKKPFILCVLDPALSWQCQLDLVFNPGTLLKFFIKGTGTVHLTGYEILDDLDDLSMSISSVDDDDEEEEDGLASSDDQDEENQDEATDEDDKKTTERMIKTSGRKVQEVPKTKTNGVRIPTRRVASLANNVQAEEEDDDDESDDSDFDLGDLDEEGDDEDDIDDESLDEDLDEDDEDDDEEGEDDDDDAEHPDDEEMDDYNSDD